MSVFSMIGNAVGTVGSWLGIGEKRQDERQIKQQEKLQELQMEGGKEMSAYQMQMQQAKEMDMWNKTNYGAQKKHMQDAGINPALMYGMSGGGGTTVGGSGAGAMPSGGHADGAGVGQRNVMDMAALAANIKLMNSQAKKNEAEADKIEGVDTREGEMRILDLTQGIQNKIAIEKLTKTQNLIQDLDRQIKDATVDTTIQQIVWTAEKARNELQLIQNETYISNETRDKQIEQIEIATLGMAIENEAKKSGINVNQAQIEKIANDIAQGWKGLDIQDERTVIDRFKTNIGANYQGIGNVIGRFADDTIYKLFKIGRKERETHKQTR